MKIVVQIEHRASSSRGKHEGESSFGLCDRLSRTRDNSQRQLPTDQDYAVSTREYQTDQSSLKTAPTAARSVLEKRRNQQQHTHRLRRFDTVTPYQANPRFQRPNTFETRIDDDALVEARDRGTEPRLRRLKLCDYF